jgi:hypothetical protein
MVQHVLDHPSRMSTSNEDRGQLQQAPGIGMGFLIHLHSVKLSVLSQRRYWNSTSQYKFIQHSTTTFFKILFLVLFFAVHLLFRLYLLNYSFFLLFSTLYPYIIVNEKSTSPFYSSSSLVTKTILLYTYIKA